MKYKVTLEYGGLKGFSITAPNIVEAFQAISGVMEVVGLEPNRAEPYMVALARMSKNEAKIYMDGYFRIEVE